MSSAAQEFAVKSTVDTDFILPPFGQQTTLPGTGFSSKMSLKGLNGLSYISFAGRKAMDNSWDANKMLMFSFEVKHTNPSQVSIAVGDLSFSTFAGKKGNSRVGLGVAVMKDARLAPGDNLLQVTTTSKSSDDTAFFNTLKDNGYLMRLEGFADSSNNKVIADSFASVKTQFTLPML
ncbi:hypothetical protein BG015_008616 [Linnemannia schmuckeri]|uniref:Uncharacterized protein n=1 Tax=Linnemannia schmuckeri TaxID=64567 RepID=A0A9P5RX89_9FUNG|nr:hypothetical protein BG015_008616 [Linnemannia schmuckeri]